MPDASPASSPSGKQILLGIFILWQMAFLVICNVVGALRQTNDELPPEFGPAVETIAPGWPEGEGHVWEMQERIGDISDFYRQLTGQPQNWGLFAPNVTRGGSFPAIKLRFDDKATESLLSHNEPEDYERYLRVGDFRMRRLEETLTLDLVEEDDVAAGSVDEQRRTSIRDYVRDYRANIRAFLRWKLKAWQQNNEHRDEPVAVELWLRSYRIRPPGDGPSPWRSLPPFCVARWKPRDDVVEAFDPVTGKFASVPQ